MTVILGAGICPVYREFRRLPGPTPARHLGHSTDCHRLRTESNRAFQGVAGFVSMKPVSGRHLSLSVEVPGPVAGAAGGPHSSPHGLAASSEHGRVPCLESREGTVTEPDGTKKDERQPGDTQTDGKN